MLSKTLVLLLLGVTYATA